MSTSNYPDNIDPGFIARQDDIDKVMADHVNHLEDALLKIQKTLGVRPMDQNPTAVCVEQISPRTVKKRIDKLEEELCRLYNDLLSRIPVGGPGPGGTGVTQIVAGTNITINPTAGTGIVTINSTATVNPGVTAISTGGNGLRANGDVVLASGNVVMSLISGHTTNNSGADVDKLDGKHLSEIMADVVGLIPAPDALKFTSGSYAGNNVYPRTISLSFTPKLVAIFNNAGSRSHDMVFITDSPSGFAIEGTTHSTSSDLTLTTNGFTLSDFTTFQYPQILNNFSNTYYYLALG